MAANTGVEWTDATWNPVGGCSVHSPGCTHCYAQRMAARLPNHPVYRSVVSSTKSGPVFNGTLTRAPDDHPVWTWPLRWRGAKNPKRGAGKPSLIFVGDMCDLFHEARPDEDIDRVFAVMALCPQHTFQVLTKRADRMLAYCNDRATIHRVHSLVCDLVTEGDADGVLIAPGVDPDLAPPGRRIFLGRWPLSNVWKGVSAERQREADERIPHLLATPADIRFVSCEPLLDSVDLTRIAGGTLDALLGNDFESIGDIRDGGDLSKTQHPPRLDWVIVGGESGPGARPMEAAWAQSLRDQCAAAGVAFFFKQWGAWVPDAQTLPDGRRVVLRHDDFEHARPGKKAAGRLLDGKEHLEFPEARP